MQKNKNTQSLHAAAPPCLFLHLDRSENLPHTSPSKNERRCVADASNGPLNFKSKIWKTLQSLDNPCCMLPSRTPLEKRSKKKQGLISLELVNREGNRNNSDTLPTHCPCLLPFNSCLYHFLSLGCSPLLSSFFNFFSFPITWVHKSSCPFLSAINYRLLIRQWGGKSMSVQVCFNLTEDFMIERCKLIGFLTGCWDRIAMLSKKD